MNIVMMINERYMDVVETLFDNKWMLANIAGGLMLLAWAIGFLILVVGAGIGAIFSIAVVSKLAWTSLSDLFGPWFAGWTVFLLICALIHCVDLWMKFRRHRDGGERLGR